MEHAEKKTELVESPQDRDPAQITTPMHMLQVAIERGVDTEQLSKLMDLQERYEANQARKAFTEAMAAFKADPPQIIKDRHVEFDTGRGRTEYDHATLGRVCDAVGKALADHGLSHDWEIEQSDDAKVKVTCIITHVMGHEKRVSMSAMPDASGSKNAIQQIGSTTTYLQRYTLLAATGLAPADKDTDGVAPSEPIDAEQKDALIDLIKQTSTDTKTFCDYLRVPSLDDLPAKRFHEAKGMLELKLRKQKEQSDGNG